MTTVAAHRDFLASVQERQARRRRLIDASYAFPSLPPIAGRPPADPLESNAEAGPSKLNVVNYVPEEETVRNDYCAWYGVSGRWGSEYIKGAADDEICEEYPALRRLMDLKAEMVSGTSHSPLYAQIPSLSAAADASPLTVSGTTPSTTASPAPGLPAAITRTLGPHRFDVIVITPPVDMPWSDIAALPIRQISADPGFVFLWVGKGSEDGLERGRECFVRWGFRRAEDIIWVKRRGRARKDQEDLADAGQDAVETEDSSMEGDGLGGVFAGQKEHCLMGIRGTVRRSTDSHFVHCNVDTDVIVWEEDGDPTGPRYPPYLHTLAENFCLGTRRLHLFGKPELARRGWVTLGTAPIPNETTRPGLSGGTGDDATAFASEPDPHSKIQIGKVALDASEDAAPVQEFDPAIYFQKNTPAGDGRHLLPFHPEIDSLRPRSPVRKSRGLPGGPSPMQRHGGGIQQQPNEHQHGGRQAPRGGGYRGAFQQQQQQQQGYLHPQAMQQPGRPLNNQHMGGPGLYPHHHQSHPPSGYAMPGMYGQMGYPDMPMGGMGMTGGFAPGFDHSMQAQLQFQMQRQMQMQMQMQAQMHAQQMHQMQMMMGMGGGAGMGLGRGMGGGMGGAMGQMGGMMGGGGGHGGNFGFADSPGINLAGPISPGSYSSQPRFESLPDQELEDE